MKEHIVIMGVAGCGKSSLGTAVASDCHLPLIEGDDFHSAASLEKMTRGVPLNDSDREGWLAVLGHQMQHHVEGLVLTCSALKSAYRQKLRAGCPQLRFVFMDISKRDALARVAERSGSGLHFFSPNLIDSQFDTLESPIGEPGVLRVDAMANRPELQALVADWLKQTRHA